MSDEVEEAKALQGQKSNEVKQTGGVDPGTQQRATEANKDLAEKRDGKKGKK